MLDQASFVAWANEHVVLLVVHNELGHEPAPREGTTAPEGDPPCPLYPGITCREHVNAAVDVEHPREDGLVAVPFVELCPNTWLVAPTGAVERVAEEDQFTPKGIRTRVEALQATLGRTLPPDRAQALLPRLAEATAAEEDSAWDRALRRLADVAGATPEPPASLRALVAAHLAAIQEEVAWEVEDLVGDDERPSPDVAADLRALRERVDVPVWGQRIEAVRTIDAWLATHGGTGPAGR